MAVPNRSNVNKKAIYFHYLLSKTQRSLGIVKFNHLVSTSSENGYNPSSGKFIVPEDGAYYFFLQHYVQYSDSLATIFVDGTAKSRTFARTDSKVNIACSLTINLQRNQEVYVQLERGQIWGSSSDPLTSFQGFKIA